jgi:hypothetical protein
MQNRFVDRRGIAKATESFPGQELPDVVTYDFEAPAYNETFSVLADELSGDRTSVYAHHFEKRFVSHYQGSEGSGGPFYTYSREGCLGYYSPPAFAPTDFATVYNDCIENLYEQLRGNLDLSVSLLEGRQVLSMVKKCEIITTMAAILRYGLASVRSGRFADSVRDIGRSGWEALDALHKRVRPGNYGNLWLEYQYGWRPLVQDVYATADALLNRRKYQAIRVTARSRRVDRYPVTRDLIGNGVEERLFMNSSERMLITALFAPPDNLTTTLAGFSSLNPVSIGWELIPYSFVFDWFIDIGGYLRSLESAAVYQRGFVDGFLVHGIKQETQSSIYGGVGESSYYYRYSTASSRYSTKFRTPLSSIPVPTAPNLQPRLGVSRLFSAAALLGQVLKG